MIKSFTVSLMCLALMGVALPAEAKRLRLFCNIFGLDPSIIKPVGPARAVNGVIEDGQVLLRQDFTYKRTGVLRHDLKVPSESDYWRDFELPAGTIFYALNDGPNSDWCTVPEPAYKSSCIAHGDRGYFWAPEYPPRVDAVGL